MNWAASCLVKAAHLHDGNVILLDTGVRRTELVSLDLADVDLEGQRLLVLHGKGNKQRVVRFGASAREALEDYLERFRGWGSGRSSCRTAGRG